MNKQTHCTRISSHACITLTHAFHTKQRVQLQPVLCHLQALLFIVGLLCLSVFSLSLFLSRAWVSLRLWLSLSPWVCLRQWLSLSPWVSLSRLGSVFGCGSLSHRGSLSSGLSLISLLSPSTFSRRGSLSRISLGFSFSVCPVDSCSRRNQFVEVIGLINAQFWL